MFKCHLEVIASELNDPICHSDECQIGSFSSEATTIDMMAASKRHANYILSPVTTSRFFQVPKYLIQYLDLGWLEYTDLLWK